MNFDIPTSPLRASVDAIATIIFGSLGHRKYLSAPADWVSTGVRFKYVRREMMPLGRRDRPSAMRLSRIAAQRSWKLRRIATSLLIPMSVVVAKT